MNHKKRTHSKEVTHAFFLQRRFNAAGNHLRPQRWNWSVLIRPLDQRIALQTDNKLQPEHLFNLRYFWLDGLFAAISDNFHLGFIPLFALALGAGTKQIGLLAALVNLLGAMAFFPGARLTERVRQRKRLVLWTGGGVARFTFLGLALLPLVIQNTTWAIWFVIVFNSIQAFMGNLANPAWTAIVADLVPEFVRGRYFGGRSMAMGVAALLIAPLAGFLIDQGNLLFTGLPHLGFQTIFFWPLPLA